MTMIVSMYTRSIFQFFNNIYHSSPETRRIMMLALPYFRLMQGVFLCGYGMKEIVFDGPRRPNMALCDRVKMAVSDCWTSIKSGIYDADFHVKHGLLFMAAGLSGAFAALHRTQMIHLGGAFPILQGMDFGFFVSACYVALNHNIGLYSIASTPQEKKSAVLGIISSFCYLLWGACFLLGISKAIALVFGCVALTTGGLKILSDFFQM